MKVSRVRLTRERARLGLSQRELARRAGLAQPYLSQIESGVRDPSPTVVKTLADVLGVASADLAEEMRCPNCGYLIG